MVKWLVQLQVRPKDGEALSGGAEHQIETDLTTFVEEIAGLIDRPVLQDESGKFHSLPPDQIFTAKLPTTGSELFGREKELKFLDEAWAEAHTHILTLVAWGGVGKTALVNEWLNQMGMDNYRGTERAYGWSFYSQGTGEDKQASGDTFLEDALRWFGYEGDPLKSPWDKGVRLAEMIRKQKTLLILDGLEPLQYPPGEMGGCLKDQGLQALLKELARSNPGLCIISTRLQIKDIEHAVNSTVMNIPLENLSPEAGAHLLKSLGVKGTSAELQNAADEFKGHALALNLLGSYLAAVHDGEVRKRDLIQHLTEEEEQGGHARRVMQSYERWLTGKPELDILYLLGLFDRPAEGRAIDVLRAEPPIEGLTSELQNLSDAKWQYAVKHLRDLRLLAEKDENRPDTLDCHPLLREHFGEKLQKKNPDAWREAHSRLYEFYKTQAPEYPDTLHEMEPLFSAVAHGCQAGRHQETLNDVYWVRISRKNKFYSTAKLGAFGVDLAALSGFFEIPWSRPISELVDSAKAGILNWAGFRLRALGRLQEAAQPLQSSMETSVAQKNWGNAAINAGNLSELYLTLGEMKQAVDYARQGVDFADLSGDGFQKVANCTTLADALHQAGETQEAESLFQKAETMQKKQPREYAFLYSVQGFRFCDLLLSQGQYQEVQKRADQTLKLAEQYLEQEFGLHNIGLDKLSLGRAHLLQTQEEGTAPSAKFRTGDFIRASDYLNQAVEGLRESGFQYYLPLGLFARSTLYRVQGEFPKAWNDLKEAREIAERGSMGLYLADYHLEASRLCLAEGKKEDARWHLTEAKQRIEKMGYHRRDKEVEELEGEFG